MPVCHIVGAGECSALNAELFKDGDMIIAADNGLRYLREAGIKPNYTVGDFDSYGEIPDGENIIVLPKEKDVTDLYYAARLGMDKGFTDFRFYGWSGGRLDHTVSNIQLCASLAEKGCTAYFVTDNQIMTAVSCGKISFDRSHKGYISVFSFSDKAIGVTLKGLKYPLDTARLSSNFPLGTSNEFVGTESSVSVEKGTLIVIFDA